MKVTSCESSGMEVSPTAYNACTFQIIDKWNPDQHAKTCDTMFYLSDGTGAYVWDCDDWKFLDFTGVTQSDWAAKQNEAGYIKNKPFKTLGNGLSVDENGVLYVTVKGNVKSDWNAANDSDAEILNKPFKALGKNLDVDEKGVLNIDAVVDIKDPDGELLPKKDGVVTLPKSSGSSVTSVNTKTGDVILDGSEINVSSTDSRTIAEVIADGTDITVLITQTNLDDLTKTHKWYTGSVGSINAPTADGKYLVIEVLATSSIVQRATSVVNNVTYTRTYSGNPKVWSDWKEIGSDGSGSIIYGGSFGWNNTSFTGADTVKKRATGIVQDIKGNDSNIVAADPDSGVALFTNPTSTPITVILNPAFSAGRSTGSADTLPKKINLTMTNADIDGGIGDNSHLMNGGGSILAMANLGYTNNQSVMPVCFTIPANGKFRLSFEIDGYGNLSDNYSVSANVNYVAFRQDAKVQTEAINIPWTPLSGTNSGTAGEYKRIGSWSVIRWNISTGGTAGNYSLGVVPDVDARPSKGFFAQIPVASTTGSETNHIQINQKDNGAVTILNALANKNYSGQVVFNNDSAETVSVPYTATPSSYANVPLTDGAVNSNAKNAVLKYRILNDVIYISGSIDVVADGQTSGMQIKVGNIPTEYMPKKAIQGVGYIPIKCDYMGEGREKGTAIVVGDSQSSASAQGAVMFYASTEGTQKLTSATWTFFGSYNLI